MIVNFLCFQNVARMNDAEFPLSDNLKIISVENKKTIKNYRTNFIGNLIGGKS